MTDPRRHTAYITIQGPGHDATRLPLREGITTFGRLPSNDVILLGDLVSRHHARITLFDGRATFQDLGSHNGSWVNGDRISSKLLRSEDICRIGNFRVTFHESPPGDVTAPENAPATEDIAEPLSAQRGSVLLAQIEEARTTQGEQTRALRLVIRASDALSKANGRAAYLDGMLRIALEETDGELGAFFRIDEGRPHLEAARARSGRNHDSHERPPVPDAVIAWAATKDFAVITEDLEGDLRFSDGSRRSDQPRAVICVPIEMDADLRGALYLTRGAPFSDQDLDAATALAQLATTGLKSFLFGARPGRNPLTVAHAPAVAASLRRAHEFGRSSLERAHVTILRASLFGLDAFAAEDALPRDLDRFLEAFLELAIDVVEPRGGSLETSSVGHLQVVFGLGGVSADPAGPVEAALLLRERLDRLLEHHPEIGQRRLRAGLDRGPVLTGALFGPRRSAFSIIGEPVERATRLELAAPAGVILATGALHEIVRPPFRLVSRKSQRIRGRAEPLEIYELIGSGARG